MGKQGKVVLVGAGPGDPGLLTLKGRQMLEKADVVVYDRLASPLLLEFARRAEQIDVGKRQGDHPVPQDGINDILISRARAGKLVARLKGGDPYLFGRGGEEARALRRAGIAFEVIPGVPSALAALGYGGIPATYRGVASSVHIVTGHARTGEALGINFDALWRTGGTLVFLMAVSALEKISQGLLEAGMPADTPAAVVENGTLPCQRTILAPLRDIAGRAREAGACSPAVFAVGEVCALKDELNWFEQLPLFGKTVLVTRPAGRAENLCEKLRALGARVMALPCMETQEEEEAPELERALAGLGRYEWLALTSPRGVAAVFHRLEQMGKDARALAPVKIAAIGPATADELALHGIRADYIPQRYDALHLGLGLAERLAPGQRALLLRAREGTPALPDTLQKAGVLFDDVAVYRTVYSLEEREELARCLQDGEIDWVTFTSASTVEGFHRCVPGLERPLFHGACIGPATEAAARERGYPVVTAAAATIDALIDAIVSREKKGGKNNE